MGRRTTTLILQAINGRYCAWNNLNIAKKGKTVACYYHACLSIGCFPNASCEHIVFLKMRRKGIDATWSEFLVTSLGVDYFKNETTFC